MASSVPRLMEENDEMLQKPAPPSTWQNSFLEIEEQGSFWGFLPGLLQLRLLLPVIFVSVVTTIGMEIIWSPKRRKRKRDR